MHVFPFGYTHVETPWAKIKIDQNGIQGLMSPKAIITGQMPCGLIISFLFMEKDRNHLGAQTGA